MSLLFLIYKKATPKLSFSMLTPPTRRELCESSKHLRGAILLENQCHPPAKKKKLLVFYWTWGFTVKFTKAHHWYTSSRWISPQLNALRLCHPFNIILPTSPVIFKVVSSIKVLSTKILYALIRPTSPAQSVLHDLIALINILGEGPRYYSTQLS
jgi:hypothetical protein